MTWNISIMELGALVCTARIARCDECPVSDQCAWVARGRPGDPRAGRRTQAFTGTDRQVRGKILAVLRRTETTVGRQEIDLVWPNDPLQLESCLRSLVADGLAVEKFPDRFALPD